MKRVQITMAVLAMASGGCALAQEVKLKVADWLPLSHYTYSEGGKVFMAKATELSKGRIQFQHFPAEQLGKAKDAVALAQSGVADIVNIAPAYITEKFPLSGVVELPGIYEGSCRGGNAFAAMLKPGGALHEAEYKPNGVRVLFSATLGAYRVLTAQKKVNTAADFSGLKLRTAGGPMDQTAALLGANSIRMAGPDVLPSLSRGTLDGVFWPLQSLKPWGLQGGLKYMTPNLSVGSFTMVYAISDKAWQKIPADLQKLLVEAGEYANKAHCEYVDRSEEKTIAELQAGGIVSVPLPEADLQKIQQGYAQIHAEWAEALNKRDRPGAAVLQAFKKGMASQ